VAAKVKYKLDETAMEDMFFDETCLLGIGSALPPYRLCWLINQHLDLDFICDPDLMLQSVSKDRSARHAVYEYRLPNSANRYLLYQLKNNNISLLPEISTVDYLWLVQTFEYEEDAQAIASSLRSLPDIQFCQVIDRRQLKRARSLIV